ncbi:MAG TPA: TIGR04283 family arsenosugar biosynthesis glycosyltransferase [Syntrophales bacterium]|nr:TIGR04283 family arsenosugar biosynthesis glycosyltransferase [Syntrophales bacterium]HNS53565.1 TIGR04283 family arsenosugar biosynthesis glycosyltransferase [Syntrophales bacterium]HQL89481.1 TIGR04283 family arsenosugar biosynthesis glycosyltransferase [Syntrophales bacterium]
MSRDRVRPERGPAVSVIVPVLHEAGRLDALIDHVRQTAGAEPVETILVDGSPDGESIGTVTRGEVTLLTAPAGRARQMNAGAAAATGDFLLFLHADTRLPAGAFRRIAETLSDGRHGAGAFDLRYDSERPSMRIIARAACLRSRLTRIPYGDQAHFFRRDYFEAIGGYADIPFLEDVEIMRRIKRRRERICILPEPVVTSARRQQQEGVLACTVRNGVVVALYYAGMSPERLARFYRKA